MEWHYTLIKVEPIEWSQVHEDNTCIRLVHYQQLAGTDVLVVKGRFEVSGLSTGIFRPAKEGEEGMDLRTMGLEAFAERKISGNVDRK